MNVLVKRFLSEQAGLASQDEARDIERSERMSVTRSEIAKSSIATMEAGMMVAEAQEGLGLVQQAASTGIRMGEAGLKSELHDLAPSGSSEDGGMSADDLAGLAATKDALRSLQSVEKAGGFVVNEGMKSVQKTKERLKNLQRTTDSAHAAAEDALASAQAGRFESRQSLSKLAAIARDARKV